MRLYRYCLAALLSVVLAPAAAPTFAAFIALTPNDSGAIRIEGGAFGSSASHTQPLATIRGYQAAQAQFVDYASYLIFDTSSLAFTPTYGTLSFNASDSLAGLAGPGPLELWGLDTHSPAAVLALPTGNINAQLAQATSIADDLRGGSSLAPDIIGPDGLITFALNATALTQITGASGLFGVGLYDNRFGALLGGIDVLSTPQLYLSDEPVVQPVAAPAPLGLVLFALALLGLRRTRLAP